MHDLIGLHIVDFLLVYALLHICSIILGEMQAQTSSSSVVTTTGGPDSDADPGSVADELPKDKKAESGRKAINQFLRHISFGTFSVSQFQ